MEPYAIRMVRTGKGKELRKDYESGKITHGFNEFRKAEKRKDKVSNTLSTVQKDNEIFEEYEKGEVVMEKQYRIRKLTPTECYRLMGVSDEDSKKMLEVNSNSQCYKQAGNSIVVDVMCAMFSQLGFPGVKKWNESR